MSVPKAVKNRIEAAKQAETEMLALQSGTTEGGVTETTAEVTPENASPTQEVQQTEQTPVEEAPAPVAEPVATAPEAPAQPPDIWEHKFRVLQGKYDAEVPRLAEELRQLKRENAYLQQQFTASQQAPQTPKESEELPEIQFLQENMPDVYKGVAKMLERITPVDVSPQVNKISTDLFYDRLANKAPDWETINQDPKFLSWLSEQDVYTGMTKHDLLLHAYNTGNADRVATFFNGYKATAQPNQPASTSVKTPAPAQAAKKDVSKYVGPSTVSVAEPAAKTEGKIYTRADINDFYKKLSLGKLKSLPKEQVAAMKADIDKAVYEKRIVG